jgi:hypothetical protein
VCDVRDIDPTGEACATLTPGRIVATKERIMDQQDFVLDIEELSEVTEEENAATASRAPAVTEAVLWVNPPV